MLITVSSDDPATLESVQYVSIATDKSNIHQVAASVIRPPACGAKSVPAGTYRVSASTKLGTGFAVVVECDGKEKEKAVSLRLPKASATLSLSMARAAGLSSEEMQIALIANDDFSVMTHASTQGEQPRIVKLPPGTYRVRDYPSRKVREEVPAITLGEGESKAVEISLPRQTGVKTAIVCVWSSDGVLVPDAAPRVVDADGKASELTGRWGLGGVYAASTRPLPGRARSPRHEAITKEFDVAGADKMIQR